MSTPSVGQAPQAEQFSKVQSGVVMPAAARSRSRARNFGETAAVMCAQGST